MPRLVNRNPSYRLHKSSGQALVTLNGEDVYLGPHGSKASRQEYDRVIAEWLGRGRQPPAPADSRRVADVIKAYWDFAQTYYGHGPEGGRGELDCIKRALGVLRRAYGQTPARDFGPLALQVVRDGMIGMGWSRTYVNSQVGRLKRCFKWASSRELVPPALFHGLQSVAGLRHGKTDARETDPVRPVPEAWVEATVAHVSRQVEGLIRLQLATGMRPGEAVILRGCDLDTTGDVWVYRPQRHKTQHRGHERVVYLGPRAKVIVGRFLRPDLNAYLFSPADAERERREALHETRATPESCGNRLGSNRRRAPKKAPKERYTVRSYHRAIMDACDQAFPPPQHLARLRVPARGRKAKRVTRWETPAEWRARLGEKGWAELTKWRHEHRWHPHRLRHSAATRLRKQYGLEAARVVLGHRSAAVAEVYAEIDQEKARQIMGEVG